MMGQDLGIIIAIVGSTMAIVGVVISMMYWISRESKALRMKDEEERKELFKGKRK